MDEQEAAASIIYLLGVVPAGVVAYRRRRADGVTHVLARATAWPLYGVLGLLLGPRVWDGSSRG